MSNNLYASFLIYTDNNIDAVSKFIEKDKNCTIFKDTVNKFNYIKKDKEIIKLIKNDTILVADGRTVIFLSLKDILDRSKKGEI